jgi:ABC-type Fe3+ transport system substrate-binding protein
VFGLLLLLLVGPFLLRPRNETSMGSYDQRLVIMTPHHEAIRREFSKGFTDHWYNKTGKKVYIDWRAAGTSELSMILKSDYTAAFENYWTTQVAKPWTHEVLSEFMNPKAEMHEARQAFLQSNISIGVDLFFGGGPPDFIAQAELGTLIAHDPKTGAGFTRIMQQHPEWFTAESIPATLSGETFRDAQLRWCGTALSSFGIVYNRDLLKRIHLPHEPTQWADLAQPQFLGNIALADPTKSGSVNKAFEMLVQQQMQIALAKLPSSPEAEAQAIRSGWIAALNLIQRISGNARYYTDSAPKIPLEVSQGDAAAGMCIDFHGRSAQELVRKADGSSRVGYISPLGGSSLAVDPIALLRGAPEPELAEAFMTYVLSDEGQRLWTYRKGSTGGPTAEALRRLAVRKDFYHAGNFPFMADGEERPFEKAQSFVYHPEWTSSVFHVLRFIIRVSCVDSHQEQRRAWAALVKANFPKRATQVYEQMDSLHYDYAKGELSQILRARDKVREVRETRRLVELFRSQYRLAEELAYKGE